MCKRKCYSWTCAVVGRQEEVISLQIEAHVKGMTFLLRPLDSARQRIRVLGARCSLRACCLGLFCCAIPCPAMPVSGIFSHCYHFSPLSGSDISFRSPSLFLSGSLLTYSFILLAASSFVFLFFSLHGLVLSLWLSAFAVFLQSFMLSFFWQLLPSSLSTERPSAPWLGRVNQTVILWADRLSLPLLCC